MNLDFSNLADREIAEQLFKQYGRQLFQYSLRSWNLDEDDIWDMLYSTLYSFINAYGNREFASEKQLAALIWKIFKNKLRDRYRQKREKEKHLKEIALSERDLISSAESSNHRPIGGNEHNLTSASKMNLVLQELEIILDELQDWERQLVICRANNIPYKEIEALTGKKEKSLKVYYQRLKSRIAKDLKERVRPNE